MIKLKNILQEEVPFEKASQVKAGLQKKYGNELDAYTFGIELEYRPNTENLTPDHHDLAVALQNNQYFLRDYESWVEDQRRSNNRRLRSVDDWDDSYGPIDLDTFDELRPEPQLSDYDSDEEYDTTYRNWELDRRDVIRTYNMHDNHEYLDDYTDQVIRIGYWQNYIDISGLDLDKTNIDNEISEAEELIEDMGEKVGPDADKTHWNVGPDASNVVEIRSKHLTVNDFDLVRDVSNYVRKKNVGGDTSAHVHVGLPKDFDAFDILAMITLVDERAIKAEVGPDRELATFARLRDKLLKIIVRQIVKLWGNDYKKPFVISNDVLYIYLITAEGLSRYYGTNIKSINKLKTIEFRYLSSEVTKNVETFIKWIQYYLLLPRIAQSRNKVVLRESENVVITAIREPGRVRFLYGGTKGKLPNYPASDIKTKNIPDAEKPSKNPPIQI